MFDKINNYQSWPHFGTFYARYVHKMDSKRPYCLQKEDLLERLKKVCEFKKF